MMGVNEKKEIDNIQTQANGFPFKWAEKMMDQMEKEQNRTLFGREEKNLICNYAYHVGNAPEVQTLIKEMADSRFELQYGYVDPKVQKNVQAEIDQIDRQWALRTSEQKSPSSVRTYLKQHQQKSACDARDTRNVPDKAKNSSKIHPQRETGR